MFRHRTGNHHVRIADAAFVLIVVEDETVELVHDRPVRLTRGTGKAGEHHVGLVTLQHAPHELLVARVVGLRVVGDQLDLAPGDAALGIDLVGCQLDAVHLADRGDGKIA